MKLPKILLAAGLAALALPAVASADSIVYIDQGNVWSASPDGSGTERLSPPCPTGQSLPKCVDDRSPVYSPNGTHIAFVRTTRRPVVMVAGAGLGRARPVAGLASFRGRPYAVAWSPNGRQLVFASAGDKGQALYLVPTKGKGVRRLTPLALEAGGRPDWSPDGKRILFHSYASRLGGVGVNLYTIRPDGTGLVQLTHFQDSERVLGGAYSPDGTSVVFSTTARVTDPTAGLPDIAVMRADGTGVKPVTRSQNWDTSPDWGARR